jgi:hypothetical protein
MNGQLKVKLSVILIVLILAACQPAAPAPLPAVPSVPPTSSPQSSPTASALPTKQVIATSTAIPEPTTVDNDLPVPTPDGSLTLMPVTQYGGSITAFAVEDNLLFAAHGPRLIVYDIADPSAPRQMGEPFLLNWLAADLVIQDRFLYMIDRDERLFIFHAPDPETMYVNGAYEGAGSSRIFIQDEWGFTSSDACEQGACTSTLKLFALSAPAAAEPASRVGAVGPDLPLTATLEIPGGILKIFSIGEYAVVAHQNGLLVAKLPDLQVVHQFKSESAYDAVYRTPHLYLMGWGFMRIFDLTDPLNPIDVTPSHTASDWFVGLPAAIIGDTLYGFDTFGEFGYCLSSLETVDLTNPVQPAKVALDSGTVPGFTCAARAQAYEDLFIVLDRNGLHLIDVSQLGLPVTVSSIPNQPGTVEVMTNRIGFGRSGIGMDNLMVFDLNDPSAVQPHGPFPPQWIMRIVQNDQYLFIPAWEDGLHVVDIANPTAPASVAHITSEQMGGPGLDAALWNNFLFVARETGLSIFDMNNPLELSQVGEYKAQRSGENWESTSKVATGEDFGISLQEVWQEDMMFGRLTIFSLSNLPELEMIAELDIDDPFIRSDLQAAGQFVYLLTSGCSGECSHTFRILDLRNPAQPVLLSTTQMAGEATTLTIHENRLFVTAGTAGVYAWNISDPGSPVLAAHVNTPGSVTGATVDNDWLVLSDGDGGIIVYSIGQ